MILNEKYKIQKNETYIPANTSPSFRQVKPGLVVAANSWSTFGQGKTGVVFLINSLSAIRQGKSGSVFAANSSSAVRWGKARTTLHLTDVGVILAEKYKIQQNQSYMLPYIINNIALCSNVAKHYNIIIAISKPSKIWTIDFQAIGTGKSQRPLYFMILII